MRFLRYLPFLFSLSTCFAQEIQIVGHFVQPVRKPTPNNTTFSTPIQSISLLKIQLSSHARTAFLHRKHQVFHPTNSNLPSQVQLGMNQVPTLNQGSHGTCVMFANTAALDAALNKGDYISQLCQLELGRYLENNGYSVSGWDGSWGLNMLNQINMFGFVNKKKQGSLGCDGLFEYPVNAPSPDNEMPLVEYHALSEPLPQDLIGWSTLLDLYQVALDHTDMDQVLQQVKTALYAGDRLTFGVLFIDYNQGIAGAVGSYHETYDSWILTPEILADLNEDAEFAGHEMVITGYDDNAIAVDNQGRKHQGLLTLRNSWGNLIGDHGDFYMSYDYFKTLALEVQRIRVLPREEGKVTPATDQ